MKQRLCLARTLAHDPQVLILDEPASGLDPRARIEIRELLLELARLGKTIFFSTHILADVAEICTQVGIIEAGKPGGARPAGGDAAAADPAPAAEDHDAGARRARRAEALRQHEQVSLVEESKERPAATATGRAAPRWKWTSPGTTRRWRRCSATWCARACR